MKPFLLQEKISNVFSQPSITAEWRPTGESKDLYLRLSELIVRPFIECQDEEGRIIDPFAYKEIPMATARFVGALGGLILAGRCHDLVEACANGMDCCCHDLFHADHVPLIGAEFYVKELMLGYIALKDKVEKARCALWGRQLGGYDPEKNYYSVLSNVPPGEIGNFNTFALVGEAMKRKFGVADNGAWINQYVPFAEKRFTEFGMYCQPDQAITYDWVVRMNLSLLLYFGYDGEHRSTVDELLRRGGLTTCLFLSPAGEAPYGGRSNQYHHNEATLALVCEYEAVRHMKLGNNEIAGVFKRMARLAAISTRRWLEQKPFRTTKNSFPPCLEHGRAHNYGFYSVYSLLAASQFGFAHLLADEAIAERPTAWERSSYMLQLPDKFHKIFATCQGHQIEIDTRGDMHYDATGLGRIHRAGFPSEIGLSTSILSHPQYLMANTPSPRNVCVGPGWADERGVTYWLADYSSESIKGATVEVVKETPEEIEIHVTYLGEFLKEGEPRPSRKLMRKVTEIYQLNKDGVTITDIVDPAPEFILAQIPLIKTDGLESSKISQAGNSFRVEYQAGCYQVECKTEKAVHFLETFAAPNANGVYAVGCLRAPGGRITYKIVFGNAATPERLWHEKESLHAH